MLGCMESLGKRYLDCKLDYEYEFYDKYLSSYENYDINEKNVKASDTDSIIFSNLNNLYSESYGVSSDKRSMVEEYADSFVFFVSAGVIKLIDNKYYINLEELNKFKERYNEVSNETSYGSAYCKKK